MSYHSPYSDESDQVANHVRIREILHFLRRHCAKVVWLIIFRAEANKPVLELRLLISRVLNTTRLCGEFIISSMVVFLSSVIPAFQVASAGNIQQQIQSKLGISPSESITYFKIEEIRESEVESAVQEGYLVAFSVDEYQSSFITT